MPGPKARLGKGKVRRKKGKKPHSKASRNWARIRTKWLQSDMALATFCRAEKLPVGTAKRYLNLKDRNNYHDLHVEAGESFRARLATMAAKEDTRLYISSLKHVSAAVQEVLLDSAEAFKADAGMMCREKAGRLVLSSGDMLLRVTSELQGVPDEDDTDGWPLTKVFQPFRYQRDFCLDTPKSVRLEEGLSDDGSQDPFIFAFIGGRGAGKTYVGAQKAGQLAWLNRRRNGVVLAPTYPMLRDGAKAMFLKACSDKGLTFKHLKTENAVILFGDTKVFFRSMDDPDKIRGLNVAWAWPDEIGQLTSREAFDILNGCIRGENIEEPAMILTTTPDGINWLYDVIVTEADKNRARLYRARTKDNPTLGDYEQRLRSSYDPRFAAQELDAEFINLFSGQAYWNFSPIENIFDGLEINEGLPLDLCCDFNVSPMCWNISQDVQTNGHVYTYVFDEIHLDTAGTDVTVKEFIDRYGESRAARRAGVRVWGDASGQHHGTSATRSDYEIIEKALKAEEIPVDINIGRSNPRQRDRVLSVNARLMDANGVRKLFLSEKCKQTKIDFERTAFIPGTQQLDKKQAIGSTTRGRGQKPQLTHHTDAIGYKIFRVWPVRGPVVTQ